MKGKKEAFHGWRRVFKGAEMPSERDVCTYTSRRSRSGSPSGSIVEKIITPTVSSFSAFLFPVFQSCMTRTNLFTRPLKKQQQKKKQLQVQSSVLYTPNLLIFVGEEELEDLAVGDDRMPAHSGHPGLEPLHPHLNELLLKTSCGTNVIDKTVLYLILNAALFSSPFWLVGSCCLKLSCKSQGFINMLVLTGQRFYSNRVTCMVEVSL